MTSAAWAASIEAVGTLTNALSAFHIEVALADVDPALGGLLLAGTALTAGNIAAREELTIMRSLYASNAVTNPGGLLVAAARTTLINRGQAAYAAAGLP